MNLAIELAALISLMLIAYRGYSVILFAPIAALGAVMLTNPGLVAPMFTGLFMDKMVVFIKLYFPVFLLGAVFGKTIELSRFSKSIVISVINLVGSERAILSIVVVCSILTYGGVSLFVVVFAVYPFAAEMFRRGYIPKRLIPGAIALGAFTFTMDALPGTPQIQNVIPTSFFKTTIYAAPCLGIVGSAFILVTGLSYLNWRRRQALASGEGYGVNVLNESQPNSHVRLPHPLVAILPLLLVAVSNKVFSAAIPALYGQIYSFTPTVVVGKAVPVVQDISAVTAIWAIEGALLVGILSIFALAWKPVTREFTEGSKSAIAGAVMASVNTASVYGFGAVIAGLPGFLVIANASKFISNPLVNEATTVTSLAGITGSASGGLSIALAAMSDTFVQNAKAAGVPLEEFHRIASMASGGLDTLPHNGAVITLLAVTGLTHRQSYGDIFALTLVKTSAVLVCISFYQLTGLV